MVEMFAFPHFWEWSLADWYNVGAKAVLWTSGILIFLHKVEPKLSELIPKEPPRKFWFIYDKFVIVCSIIAISTRRNDEFASNTITPAQLDALHQIAFERRVSLIEYVEETYNKPVLELTKREASDSVKRLKEWARSHRQISHATGEIGD